MSTPDPDNRPTKGAREHRSRLEMMFDTLAAITNGETSTTHLCAKVNLNWKALTEILDEMEKKGLTTAKWVPEYNELVRREVKSTVRGRELLLSYLSLRASLFPDEVPTELYLPPSDWAQAGRLR